MLSSLTSHSYSCQSMMSHSLAQPCCWSWYINLIDFVGLHSQISFWNFFLRLFLESSMSTVLDTFISIPQPVLLFSPLPIWKLFPLQKERVSHGFSLASRLSYFIFYVEHLNSFLIWRAFYSNIKFMCFFCETKQMVFTVFLFWWDSMFYIGSLTFFSIKSKYTKSISLYNQ